MVIQLLMPTQSRKTLMIILKDNLDMVGETVSRYLIIRRDGAVVPFESSKVAETTLKAFLAIHGTLNGRHRLVSQFSEMLLSVGESTLVWLYEIWPSALHRNQALPVHKSRASLNVEAIELFAAGKKLGFFSAVKPNLRNAP